MGRSPTSPGRKEGTPPEGGGSLASPLRRRGRLEALTRPLRAPSGWGAKSDPGPRTGGDLPGWVGPGLAGRRPRATRWGRARRPWGPRGRQPGLVGTSRPGARACPGTWQITGLPAPGSRPRYSAGPTPSCALIWVSGRDSRGSPRPPASARTLACCHSDQDPLSDATPAVGPMESSPDSLALKLSAGAAG